MAKGALGSMYFNYANVRNTGNRSTEGEKIMKKGKLSLTSILILAAAIFLAGNGFLNAKKTSRSESNDALDLQRALAYQDIQNLISAHTYCYEAQKQYYEIEHFWSKKEDISYNTNSSREETINYYCVTNEKARKAKLEKMSELFPNEVKNIKENLGVGDMVIHLVTTPYVVVAGDCQTARGLWYVPSVNVEIGVDGQPVPVTIWEKCDVDFIKEDNGWKIWHFRQWVQFAAPLDKSLVDGSFRLERPFFTPQPLQQQAEQKNQPVLNEQKEKDQAYSTKRIADWRPSLPEPYDTWDDLSLAKGDE